MAGDWLKVEKGTPEKPEVMAISHALQISLGDAFLCCFRVWRWADTHTVDGNAPRVTPAMINDIAHTPGFAQALIDVGWLHVREGALHLPNFDRHMGQSGKSRALTAKRVASHRAGQSTQNVTVSTLPEKRREEKKNKTPRSPPADYSPDFLRFWEAYPKNAGKLPAFEVWLRIGPDPALQVVILAALERHKKSDQWVRDGGRYIPDARTWLRQQRWTDELSEASAGGKPLDDLFSKLKDTPANGRIQ